MTWLLSSSTTCTISLEKPISANLFVSSGAALAPDMVPNVVPFMSSMPSNRELFWTTAMTWSS